MDFNTGFRKDFLERTNEHWLLNVDARVYGSGRAAFIDAAAYLKKNSFKRLWIPAWQCDELVVALKKANDIDVKFYHLNDDLVPDSNFLLSLSPNEDALLLVDYFASVKEEALKRTLQSYKGPIFFDAVHSWLLNPTLSTAFPELTLFSGFRKLFWKGAGCIVTGGIVKDLADAPALIADAAPHFPRNMTLAPRLGLLSRAFLSRNNLNLYDQIAQNWQTSEGRGVFSALHCPVELVKNAVSRINHAAWHWPDLYQNLSSGEQENALKFKQIFSVENRSSEIG